MKKGEIYFTGRYIPDNRILKHEPAGTYEDPVAPGVNELRVEPLSVITITPRPIRRKRKSIGHKIAVMLSAVILPVLFVTFADLLAVHAGLFFGSLAVAMGWPAFVVWANYRD